MKLHGSSCLALNGRLTCAAGIHSTRNELVSLFATYGTTAAYTPEGALSTPDASTLFTS
jgi:hypothetical protein